MADPIASALSAPASMTNAAGERADARPGADLIALDTYAAQKAAAGVNPLSGMRLGRFRMPGPIGAANSTEGTGGQLLMFDGIKRFLGINQPARREPQSMGGRVRAKYDAVQTDDENANRWALADLYSAKSANNFQVRQIARRRSRYEIANNSYGRGMVLTLANDLIGKGPRLKLQTGNETIDRDTERPFSEWAYAVGLAERLHVMALAKKQDGEGIGLMVTNRTIDNPVQLDWLNIEADQCMTPMPFFDASDWVDGLVLDKQGNVVAYNILDQHPGDYYFANFNPLKYRTYRANQVVHWFRKDRPGQVRGVPEILPALPLFNQLRLFTQATLTAAETAAQFAAIIKTNAPADGSTMAAAGDIVDIERGQFLTLANEQDITQLEAAHPGTTYPMFKAELLKEIARCLNIPYNVASGDSSGYNYSSSKLDHILYGRSMQVERAQCERLVLDKIFRAWLAEAVLIPGLLPPGLRASVQRGDHIPHRWYWDPVESADPVKDATADQIRLETLTTDYEEIYAEKGEFWGDAFDRIAAQKKRMRDLDIEPADMKPPVAKEAPNESQAAA